MVLLCYDGSADAKAAIDRALQHADRPVIVVPSPEVTQARAQHRRDRRQ